MPSNNRSRGETFGFHILRRNSQKANVTDFGLEGDRRMKTFDVFAIIALLKALEAFISTLQDLEETSRKINAHMNTVGGGGSSYIEFLATYNVTMSLLFVLCLTECELGYVDFLGLVVGHSMSIVMWFN